MSKRAAYEWYKQIVVAAGGPLKTSKFQEEGKLTPEEFIAAGEALVQKCPAWEWAKGNPALQKYFPEDKKFLILRNAPSSERAAAMMAIGGDTVEGEDEWEITHADHKVKKEEEKEEKEDADEMDWDDEDGGDDAKAPAPASENTMRTYNLTVVYDEYYCSPRMYLIGHNADNQPLTDAQMMEDVYSENVGKTVTLDPHPYMDGKCISIHPCRHAETMKRILQRMADRIADEQEEAEVPEKERLPFVFPSYMALFVFLKFISSVVPTIAYDISMDVDM